MLKKKKTKKITLFVMFAALLSVGCIGFSSWILSLGDGTSNLDVQIVVETVYNESKIVQINGYNKDPINLDTSITEEEAIPLGIKAKVIVSDDEIAKGNGKTISVSVSAENKSDENDEVDYNLIKKSGDSSSTDVFGRKGGTEYTYLSLTETTITIVGSFTDYPSAEGYKYIDNISLDTLGIKYGSYFENKNPEEFYTDTINQLKKAYESSRSKEDLNNYLNAMSLAKQDVANMQTAINDKNIVITLEVK